MSTPLRRPARNLERLSQNPKPLDRTLDPTYCSSEPRGKSWTDLLIHTEFYPSPMQGLGVDLDSVPFAPQLIQGQDLFSVTERHRVVCAIRPRIGVAG